MPKRHSRNNCIFGLRVQISFISDEMYGGYHRRLSMSLSVIIIGTTTDRILSKYLEIP